MEIFLTHLTEIWEALDYVGEMLNCFETQTVEEIDQFEAICRGIGLMWRQYFEKSVPPKLHLLESHFPAEFRKYKGRLGFFGEDAVERQHNIINRYNRVYANIASFVERQKAIQTAKEQAQLPKVVAIITGCETGSKRKVGTESMEKKEGKGAAIDQEKYVKKQRVLRSCLDLNARAMSEDPDTINF